MNYRVVSRKEQRRLYREAKAGSEEARNALAESVMPWGIVCANRCAIACGLTDDDVTECADAGVEAAMQKWKPGQGSLTTYVFHAVRWRCLRLNEMRQKRHKRVAILNIGDGYRVRDCRCERPGPARRVETASSIRRMLSLLPTLSERLERVLRAYYFESLTLKEIGSELGLTKERVRQLKLRALKLLRERMGEDAEDSNGA